MSMVMLDYLQRCFYEKAIKMHGEGAEEEREQQMGWVFCQVPPVWLWVCLPAQSCRALLPDGRQEREEFWACWKEKAITLLVEGLTCFCRGTELGWCLFGSCLKTEAKQNQGNKTQLYLLKGLQVHFGPKKWTSGFHVFITLVHLHFRI